VRRRQPEFLQEEAQQREQLSQQACGVTASRTQPCRSAARCSLADLRAAGELAGLLVHSHPHAAVFIPELCWPRCTHQILQSTSQLIGLPILQAAHPVHMHICQNVPSLHCQ
jgi:hypothetical protein